MGKDAIVAPDNYSRWKIIPSAFLVQICIGSVYAFSIFNGPLTRDIGVVGSCAMDWDLSQVVPIFSTMALCLGITTAALGPWAERSGPRKVACAAGMAYGGGLLLSSIGSEFHQLPMLYVGYGILGGIGWGLGYISPVSTMMKWFPDRRGLATGLALTAFGGGAMLATPITEYLYSLYFELPTYLGAISDVEMYTEGGRRFVETASGAKEVIVTSTAEMASLPVNGPAGVYLLGTGSSGTSKVFLTLSAAYFTAIMSGGLTMCVPKEGWKPLGWKEEDSTPKEGSKKQESSLLISAGNNVHYNQVFRTPQWYLLWTAVVGNAVAGVSIISCAKTMMSEIFSTALPTIVTGGFAATYVAMLSAGNMTGRLMWATASDYTGRKNAYYIFGTSIPIALCIPKLTSMVADMGATGAAGDPSILPLVLFYGGTTAIVSFYGGLFSVLPAYIADLYGQKHTGAIHGRTITGWSAAALLGPTILTHLRSTSYRDAAMDLVSKVDPEKFREAFGADVQSAPELLSSKTLTLAQLMDIAPQGTIDPTPHLYDTTMYAMAGLLSVALCANAMIRPVHPKHHIRKEAGDEKSGVGE